MTTPTRARILLAAVAMLIAVPVAAQTGETVEPIEPAEPAETAEDLSRALQLAAAEGRTDDVKALLERGAEPNAPVTSRAGKPLDGPLAAAVLGGHFQVVKKLLEAGADPDGDRGKVWTYVLTLPLRVGTRGQIKVALGRGRFQRKMQIRYLREAAEEGKLESVKRYLEQGQRSLVYGDHAEITAAVERGDAELVRALIEPPEAAKSAYPAVAEGFRLALGRRDRQLLRRLIAGGLPFNGVDRQGHTPLVVAARFGWLPAIDDLLGAGADVNLVDLKYVVPLASAIDAGNSKVVAHLLAAGARVGCNPIVSCREPLSAAVEAQRLDLVRQLVGHLAPSDPADEIIGSALTMAANRGHDDIVQELQRLGRDLVSLGGVCRRETVLMLLAAGVPPDRPDRRGRYPLPESVDCNDRGKTLQLLVERGADPDVRTGPDVLGDEGVTALMKVANDRHKDLLEYLLFVAGADPDVADDRGETALIKASRSAKTEPVNLLIDAAANLDLADQRGETALMKAAKGGHGKVMTLLLQAGAGESLTDLEGRTAWQLFWQRVLEKGVERQIEGPGGDYRFTLPHGFRMGDTIPMPIIRESAELADTYSGDALRLKISLLGRPVELDPFDPSVVTSSRMPEVRREPWRGHQVPLLGIGPAARWLAVVPWGDDTLLIRLTGGEAIDSQVLWVLRGILHSLRPVKGEAVAAADDPSPGPLTGVITRPVGIAALVAIVLLVLLVLARSSRSNV